jgi:hypothetical protein
MSLKVELDKLAGACGVCVDKEGGPIDRHFDSCPSCQDYNKKAEELEQMVEVLELNAAKSEEDRYKILEARINGFLQLDDTKRKDAVGNMLDALSELSEKDRIKIVTTRTKILMGLSKEQRNILFGTVREIVPDWDIERRNMEMRAVMAATQDLMLLKRMMVRKMFKKILNS